MSASVAITEAKRKFAEFVNRAEYGRERIVIKRRGKPIAAIIGMKDLELLEMLGNEYDSQLLWKLIKRAGKKSIEPIIADYEYERDTKFNRHPDAVSGIFKDDPLFEEFLEILREMREEDYAQVQREFEEGKWDE
ncbi:type II toxin-antitoxin system Phd/YefM family antitoxin [Candidatus Poribacteria bacterium]|nr:type II toxin-antitoxin system Phd/YefM family antitoxin [Candidatus Poribacteria bacterium]